MLKMPQKLGRHPPPPSRERQQSRGDVSKVFELDEGRSTLSRSGAAHSRSSVQFSLEETAPWSAAGSSRPISRVVRTPQPSRSRHPIATPPALSPTRGLATPSGKPGSSKPGSATPGSSALVMSMQVLSPHGEGEQRIASPSGKRIALGGGSLGGGFVNDSFQHSPSRGIDGGSGMFGPAFEPVPPPNTAGTTAAGEGAVFPQLGGAERRLVGRVAAVDGLVAVDARQSAASSCPPRGRYIDGITTAGRLAAGMTVGHDRVSSTWQPPEHRRSRFTATATRFHQLTRPASLHQLLPPHEHHLQNPPSTKPTKLRRGRSLSPEQAKSSPQSWVECQSLNGWLPQSGMPPVLDASSSSPTRRIARPAESGVLAGARC